MVERACAIAEVSPSRALMVGDTSFDMEMGKAAGVSSARTALRLMGCTIGNPWKSCTQTTLSILSSSFRQSFNHCETKRALNPIAIGVEITEMISRLQWLRYGPFLSQIVITRRCNLSCGYCFEFDKTSSPIPYETLDERFHKLRELRSWVVCFVGGEPTLHPELVKLVRRVRELGFRRRQLITNGFCLTEELVRELNDAGLSDLQLSVDGVRRNDVTEKVIEGLAARLEMLGRVADFRVTLSAVIGSSPPEEALEVVNFAEANGFKPRVLLIHDEDGLVKLSPEELSTYRSVKDRLGRYGREAGDYRDKLLRDGRAPFRCRSGARYLYIDEFGEVRWCSQRREPEEFSMPLMDYSIDTLRQQFETAKDCNERCSIGCARTASAFDQWRPQVAF